MAARAFVGSRVTEFRHLSVIPPSVFQFSKFRKPGCVCRKSSDDDEDEEDEDGGSGHEPH